MCSIKTTPLVQKEEAHYDEKKGMLMKKIHLDFRNRIILIETESQNEPDAMDRELRKAKFKKFMPEEINIFMYDSFSFDFEKGVVTVNEIVPDKMELRPEDFKGIESFPYPKLTEQFEEILEVMGYAEAHWTEEEMDYLDTIGFLNSLHMI